MRVVFRLWILAVGMAMFSPSTRAADASFFITTAGGEAALGSWPGVVVPGSNILILSFGTPIGPANAQSAGGYPLVTSLAGASVTITVKDTSLSAFLLGAESHWIRATLPGNTPLGDGSLAVTYNGRTSEPYKIRVVERLFRFYDGSWCGPSAFPATPSFCVPRAVQNIESSSAVTSNSLLTPAKPGQLVALWGTGLGVAPGDERSGPIPGMIRVPSLQVIIGNRRAEILYTGRSGCCAGMDEILVRVPEGVEGCNVPAWVRFAEDGSASNDIFLSIASGSGACSDPQGLSEVEVRKLAGTNLRAAQILAFDGPEGGWSAWFGAASGTGVIPFGTCRASTWGASFAAEMSFGSLLNAGAALNLATPLGRFVANRLDNGMYGGALRAGLEPGQYAIDNGSGGPQVGAFLSVFSLSRRDFTWTNQDAFNGLPPRKDLVVEWNSLNAAGQVVLIGTFDNDGEVSSTFLCYERPDKGGFTIPWAVIERFRAAASPYANEFRLAVGYQLLQRISIPEFDVSQLLLPGASATKAVALE
jgi:uncharacterized protein (TIGR03437 family)